MHCLPPSAANPVKSFSPCDITELEELATEELVTLEELLAGTELLARLELAKLEELAKLDERMALEELTAIDELATLETLEALDELATLEILLTLLIAALLEDLPKSSGAPPQALKSAAIRDRPPHFFKPCTDNAATDLGTFAIKRLRPVDVTIIPPRVLEAADAPAPSAISVLIELAG